MTSRSAAAAAHCASAIGTMLSFSRAMHSCKQSQHTCFRASDLCLAIKQNNEGMTVIITWQRQCRELRPCQHLHCVDGHPQKTADSWACNSIQLCTVVTASSAHHRDTLLPDAGAWYRRRTCELMKASAPSMCLCKPSELQICSSSFCTALTDMFTSPRQEQHSQRLPTPQSLPTLGQCEHHQRTAKEDKVISVRSDTLTAVGII